MKKIIVFLAILGLGYASFQARALTISPAKIFLSADPGQILETSMKVGNDSDQTVVYYPIIEKYSTTGGEEPVFGETTIGLPTWIETVPLKLSLGPKEVGEAVVRIKVPDNAEPGGHYAVIFWSSAPPKGKTGTSVGITMRVGALVFLEVSGEVAESAEISNFQAVKKISRSRPLGFYYSFLNTGNVHLTPQGKVLIKNIFGKTVATIEANAAGFSVLPGTTRHISTANWEAKTKLTGIEEKIKDEGLFPGLRKEIDGFGLGYYKAYLYLEYGKKGGTSLARFGFWIIPWQIILFSLLVLAVILLIFTKGLQKYNQWLINKAKEKLKNGK